MNASTTIPRCAPPLEFANLPFHWVQWRTPFRGDPPQPWGWNTQTGEWQSCAGVSYTPQRAASLQWHYLEPAHLPTTTIDDEEIIVQLAALLSTQYHAVRYQKPQDHPLVQSVVLERLQTIGLPQAYGLVTGLAKLGLQIVHR
jgi:hypothetical protein